jgi:predicted lipoprotein with Yx(FWY)xxD motif
MQGTKHGKGVNGRDVHRRGLTRLFAVSALTAALAAIGFLSAGSIAQSATRATGTVNLRTTKLGSILVTSKGRTLYLFMKDKNDKSACGAACAAYWPPLLATAKPTAGAGVKASLLGRTRRSNGTLQVTYNRHPLYRFALDTRAGQVTGQGNLAFGAKWWAVSAKGIAILKAQTSTGPTPTTTTVPYTNPPPPGY